MLALVITLSLACGPAIAYKGYACAQQVFSAEPEIDHEELELRPNQGLVYLGGQLFSGSSVERYPSGNVAERITYANGKKHGLRKRWFPSGILSYRASYQEGRLHGVSQTWWKSGIMRSESQYVMGVAQGLQRQWYPCGQLFKEVNLVDGKEEGMQRAWRENGKLYSNYEARSGRIFGLKRAGLCYELDDEDVQYKDQ